MIVLLLALSGAWAGAWTKDLGSHYAKVGVDGYDALRVVLPGEAEARKGGYLGVQSTVYAEAGVSKGHPLQLGITVPLVAGFFRSDVETTAGTVGVRTTTVRPGDLRVSVQTAFKKGTPFSVALEVKIPMYANGNVGQDTPSLAELYPKPGDGQVDLTGWLYGGAAPRKGMFLEGGAGWRHRTEAFVGWEDGPKIGDGAVFLGKIGQQVGPVMGILGVDGCIPVGKDEVTRGWFAVAANALIDVAEGVAIEPRFSAELWAQNASQGIGAGLGLSVRR